MSNFFYIKYETNTCHSKYKWIKLISNLNHFLQSDIAIKSTAFHSSKNINMDSRQRYFIVATIIALVALQSVEAVHLFGSGSVRYSNQNPTDVNFKAQDKVNIFTGDYTFFLIQFI